MARTWRDCPVGPAARCREDVASDYAPGAQSPCHFDVTSLGGSGCDVGLDVREWQANRLNDALTRARVTHPFARA